jgi:hypothetical protein
MGALRHLLIVVVIGVAFRWLWTSSLNERASVEGGRTVFPPTRAIRVLAVFFGVAFISLFLWSWFAVRKPDEWWVPYLFLGFLALSLCIYPPVLSIEVDGIGSRSWLGHEKKIRWEDIASLRYNTAIQKRTRLAIKVARPRTWKAETFEVPYEEVETEQEVTHNAF